MEASKIKSYVLCREHIDYFQKAKKELMQGKMTLENSNPHEISHTLKYYWGIEKFKEEINMTTA